jgi:hypothetical protein
MHGLDGNGKGAVWMQVVWRLYGRYGEECWIALEVAGDIYSRAAGSSTAAVK